MITIEQYENYCELVILKSPEELNLSYSIFKGLYGNACINYYGDKRMLVIRLNNSLSPEKLGEIIRYLIKQDALMLQNTSYRASVKRRAIYRHYINPAQE